MRAGERLERLRSAYEAGERIAFLFFWGHTPPADGGVNGSCLSQWWMCRFTVDGRAYTCTEQYMMAEKARLFRDEETLGRIMLAKTPKEIKELGRAVRNFDASVWAERSYAIVKRGNAAKFSQNQALRDYLLSTHGRLLVEASPFDRIWGIGLAQDDRNASNPAKWQGTNLLGFALTEVRDELRMREGM